LGKTVVITEENRVENMQNVLHFRKKWKKLGNIFAFLYEFAPLPLRMTAKTVYFKSVFILFTISRD